MNEVSITMVKARSPHRITFETDKEDPHFVNVSIKKRKSGAVVATHYIVSSDLQQWIDTYLQDGFLITNSNNQ